MRNGNPHLGSTFAERRAARLGAQAPERDESAEEQPDEKAVQSSENKAVSAGESKARKRTTRKKG